jgi:hypothetical protein
MSFNSDNHIVETRKYKNNEVNALDKDNFISHVASILNATQLKNLSRNLKFGLCGAMGKKSSVQMICEAGGGSCAAVIKMTMEKHNIESKEMAQALMAAIDLQNAN